MKPKQDFLKENKIKKIKINWKRVYVKILNEIWNKSNFKLSLKQICKQNHLLSDYFKFSLKNLVKTYSLKNTKKLLWSVLQFYWSYKNC